MSSLDPVLSDPPSDDVLAQKLSTAVDQIDSEMAYTVVMALQGFSDEDVRIREDAFRRQLSHRLEQARIRSDSRA